MDKTPLEKAREREAGKIHNCRECENCVKVGGWFYCEISGKMLHPIMLEYDPAFRCKRRESNATD